MAKSKTPIEPYECDVYALRDFERSYAKLITQATPVLSYLSTHNVKVNSWEDFETFVKNPKSYFKKSIYESSKEKYKALEGLNLDIESLIKIPEDIEEIGVALSKINQQLPEIRSSMFDVKDNKISYSELFQRKRESYFYFIEDDVQQARYDYCIQLIKAIEALEPILKSEWRGETLLSRMIDEKLYIGLNLPYPLKFYNDGTKAVLKPNERFIKNGFYGVSIPGLGIVNNTTTKPKEILLYGQRYKKVWMTFSAGQTKPYLILESEVSKYTVNPITLDKQEVAPEVYNAEGKPYGEAIGSDIILK
jgi:hypothetical protein